VTLALLSCDREEAVLPCLHGGAGLMLAKIFVPILVVGSLPVLFAPGIKLA
jgi:hypothetical protein